MQCLDVADGPASLEIERGGEVHVGDVGRGGRDLQG